MEDNIKDKKKMTHREAFGSWVRVMKMWWKREPLIIVIPLLHGIVQGITPFVSIYFVAQIINEIVGGRNLDRLILLVGLNLGMHAVLYILSYALSRWSFARADWGLLWLETRTINTEKMLTMDFANTERARTADLISQIAQSANMGGYGVLNPINQLPSLSRSIVSIITAVGLTITLFTSQIPAGGNLAWLNSPIATVVVIILILGFVVISNALRGKSESYWTKNSDEGLLGNRYFSHVWAITGERDRQLDIRMYEQDKIAKKYNDWTSYGGKLDFFTGTMGKWSRGPRGLLSAGSSAVNNVMTAVIYVFVCLKAWAGAFAVGNATQYIRAITNLSTGVSDLLEYLFLMYNNAAFLRNDFELWDMPDDMHSGTKPIQTAEQKFEIEFKNVSFKYPDTEDWVLKDVSVKLNIGGRMAIVGENGSGKTTFIKLLCRLYDPTQGQILLNGIDIREYDYKQYMNIFSVVFQDFELLAQSLGSNVSVSRKYDADRSRKCLEMAGFGEKLAEWEKGLETCLYKDFEKDGVNISGGEAQKIALARALYRDADFIILDEPTAALDPIAEFEVYSNINEIVGGKSSIFISHRLSSCRFCEVIAVFDHGRIVQIGGHDDLVADNNGKYSELWNAQAQYYVDENLAI